MQTLKGDNFSVTNFTVLYKKAEEQRNYPVSNNSTFKMYDVQLKTNRCVRKGAPIMMRKTNQ